MCPMRMRKVTLCWQLCLLNNSRGRSASYYEQPVCSFLAALFKTFAIPGLFWQGRQHHGLSNSLRMAFKASHMFLVWVCVTQNVNKRPVRWVLLKLHNKNSELHHRERKGIFFGNSVSSLAASPPLPSSRAGDPSKRVIIHDWAG